MPWKKLKTIVPEILLSLGLATLCVGAWLLHPIAGVFVAGISLIGAAVLIDLGD